MNTNKEIKNKIFMHIAAAAIGFIALFVGYVLHFQPHTMSGIAIGFIPVGLIGALIYAFGNKEKLAKQIKIENEERNIFISNKAGYKAFWITYFYVFVITMATNFINISASTLACITLIFMPIVYFSLLIFFHHKY